MRESPNHPASGNGAGTSLFHIEHLGRAGKGSVRENVIFFARWVNSVGC
jgi:hypothetical protein